MKVGWLEKRKDSTHVDKWTNLARAEVGYETLGNTSWLGVHGQLYNISKIMGGQFGKHSFTINQDPRSPHDLPHISTGITNGWCSHYSF